MEEASGILEILEGDVLSSKQIICNDNSLKIYDSSGNEIRWDLDNANSILKRNTEKILKNVSGFEPKYFPDTEVALVFISFDDNYKIGSYINLSTRKIYRR